MGSVMGMNEILKVPCMGKLKPKPHKLCWQPVWRMWGSILDVKKNINVDMQKDRLCSEQMDVLFFINCNVFAYIYIYSYIYSIIYTYHYSRLTCVGGFCSTVLQHARICEDGVVSRVKYCHQDSESCVDGAWIFNLNCACGIPSKQKGLERQINRSTMFPATLQMQLRKKNREVRAIAYMAHTKQLDVRRKTLGTWKLLPTLYRFGPSFIFHISPTGKPS